MKNLEVLLTLVKTLKKSPETKGRALAAQLEPALLALSQGKGDGAALLASVRAALAAHQDDLDVVTPDGVKASAALTKAERAARVMPKDAEGVLALERALKEATAATKKARPAATPKATTFKVRPGTRR